MYICSRNPATGIYQTMIRSVATYARETWTLTVRDTEVLRRFEGKILRVIYGPVQDPENGHYKMRSNAEIAQIYRSLDIIQEIKSGRLRWAGHLQRSQNDRLIKRV